MESESRKLLFLVGTTWLVRAAMLYVDAFLTLKKISHKTYEVTRVEESNNIRPLLKPLFDTTKHIESGLTKAVAIKNTKDILGVELWEVILPLAHLQF